MYTYPGKLVIKTLHGRNGDFNVGHLSIAIGNFVVKDTALEQYDPGEYEGEFVIGWVYPSAYISNGRSVTEVRASLNAMTISGIDDLSNEEAEKLTPQEVDPIESEPKQVPPAAPSKEEPPKADPQEDRAPSSMESEAPAEAANATEVCDERDKKLFSTLWPLGDVVQLDPTVDRQLFRDQRDRLKSLGYKFNGMSQDWHLQGQ
ncbi:MAG: DUF3275 family protein [Proteobacteria bacterium]|nr:DUF3275 family protein [Pseudomonadota bacterium]